MARLVGVDLPREKRLEIALTYIFGIGLTRSHAILAATGVSPDTRVKDLQEPDLAKVRWAKCRRWKPNRAFSPRRA